MQERNALFKELLGLGLYQNGDFEIAENEVKVDPTDERIDVDAKRALQRMLKGTDRAREEATVLISTINSGELGGIYGDSMMASVKYAKGHHTNWWSMMRFPYKDATLVLDPKDLKNGKPIIIFRSQQNAPPYDGIRRLPKRMEKAMHEGFLALEEFRTYRVFMKDGGTGDEPPYSFSSKSVQGNKSVRNDVNAPLLNIYPPTFLKTIRYPTKIVSRKVGTPCPGREGMYTIIKSGDDAKEGIWDLKNLSGCTIKWAYLSQFDKELKTGLIEPKDSTQLPEDSQVTKIGIACYPADCQASPDGVARMLVKEIVPVSTIRK